MGNYYVPNIHYVIYIHINSPYITYLPLLNHRQKHSELDPVPRVNSCPRGFCCCVKLDSSYQLSKIAEIF